MQNKLKNKNDQFLKIEGETTTGNKLKVTKWDQNSKQEKKQKNNKNRYGYHQWGRCR